MCTCVCICLGSYVYVLLLPPHPPLPFSPIIIHPPVNHHTQVLKTMNLVLDGYDYEVELLAQALVSKCKDAAEVTIHVYILYGMHCIVSSYCSCLYIAAEK